MLNSFDWGLQEAGYCCGGVRVLMQNGLQRLGEASPVRLQGCSALSSLSECSLHLIRLDPALNTSLFCFRTLQRTATSETGVHYKFCRGERLHKQPRRLLHSQLLP